MMGAAALVAGGGCLQGTGAEWMNKQSPNFSLKTLDGEQVSLSDYRGQVVLLAFWAVG